jgi:hypothetical protein
MVFIDRSLVRAPHIRIIISSGCFVTQVNK